MSTQVSLPDEVFVIDNVIASNYQDDIEKNIMGRDFPWYYVPNITRKTHGEGQLSTDSIGLAHNFIDIDKGSMSFVTEVLIPLLNQSCAKINLTPKEVYWGRIFMTLATGNTNRNLFHTDMAHPHLVCLYYINDSSGSTVILSKTHDDEDREDINNHDQSGFITHEVEPRKGRVVLFNGKYFHASTNPKEGRRCIINFDVGL